MRKTSLDQLFNKRWIRLPDPAFFLGQVVAAAALVLHAAIAPAQEPTDFEQARNFHAISETLFTSGQIYPSQIPALQEEGIDFIVNLSVADPKRNAEEPFAVMSAGINYINIPVLWQQPTREELELFFDVMDVRGERVTLVHCFANYRASAFTYLYRVLRAGVPEEEAREDLLAVWDDELFEKNPAWRIFIDEMLESGPR